MAKRVRVNTLSLSGVSITVNSSDVNTFLRHDGAFSTVVVPSQTGQLVDTTLLGNTGNYLQSQINVMSGATGSFITTSQTGQFARAAGTGIFLTSSQTGQFAPYNNVLFLTGTQTVNGVKTFNSPTNFNVGPTIFSSATSTVAVDFDNRMLWNASESPTLDWQKKILTGTWDAGGLTINGVPLASATGDPVQRLEARDVAFSGDVSGTMVASIVNTGKISQWYELPFMGPPTGFSGQQPKIILDIYGNYPQDFRHVQYLIGFRFSGVPTIQKLVGFESDVNLAQVQLYSVTGYPSGGNTPTGQYKIGFRMTTGVSGSWAVYAVAKELSTRQFLVLNTGTDPSGSAAYVNATPSIWTGIFLQSGRTDIYVPQSSSSVDATNRRLYTSASLSVSWNSRNLYDSSGLPILNWDSGRLIQTPSGLVTLDWKNRILSGSWTGGGLIISGYPVVTSNQVLINDGTFVRTTGDQNISDIKTFTNTTSTPILITGYGDTTQNTQGHLNWYASGGEQLGTLGIAGVTNGGIILYGNGPSTYMGDIAFGNRAFAGTDKRAFGLQLISGAGGYAFYEYIRGTGAGAGFYYGRVLDGNCRMGVNIGFTSPVNTLEVGRANPSSSGNVAIGESYVGQYLAPLNGMIVQGRVGLGTGMPSAMLHIGQSVSGAGFAPIKLSSYTLLGSPEGGAIEYDGSSFYLTSNNGNRSAISTGSAGAGVTSLIITGGLALQGSITLTGQNGITFSGSGQNLFINSVRPTITASLTSGNWVIDWRSGESFEYTFRLDASSHIWLPYIFMTGCVNGKTIHCSFVNTGANQSASSIHPFGWSGEKIYWESSTTGIPSVIDQGTATQKWTDVFTFRKINNRIYGKQWITSAYDQSE